MSSFLDSSNPAKRAEKLEQLRKEFNELDIDKNGYVDRKELDQFFSTRGGVNATLVQLLDIVDKNRDGKIVFEEYSSAYLDRVAELNSKINTLQRSSEEARKKKEDLTRQAASVQNEALNSEGMMTGSSGGFEGPTVIVNVLSGRTLAAADRGGTSDPYVEVNIFPENVARNQSFKTEVVKKNLNPVWNKEFRFCPVTQKTGWTLQFSVFDHDLIGSNEFLGFTSVNAEDLLSQVPLERWYPLTSRPGKTENAQGEIQLRIQFVYSLSGYYNGQIQFIQDQIDHYADEIREINYQLQDLQRPFGVLNARSHGISTDDTPFIKRVQQFGEFLSKKLKEVPQLKPVDDALTKVEKQIPPPLQPYVNKINILLSIVGILFVFFFVIVGGELTAALAGFFYPVYASFKAIESPCQDDDTQWLTYWVVYAAFNIVEPIVSPILGFIPFYNVLKLAFMVWLMNPSSMGALTVYKKVIAPFLRQHESVIDKGISQAGNAAKQVGKTVTSEGTKFVASHGATIITSALNAQNKLAEEAK